MVLLSHPDDTAQAELEAWSKLWKAHVSTPSRLQALECRLQEGRPTVGPGVQGQWRRACRCRSPRRDSLSCFQDRDLVEECQSHFSSWHFF
eukprot:5947062-Amphidinium_carterae.2